MFSMSLPFTVNKGLEETGTAEVVISQLVFNMVLIFCIYKKKKNL